MKKYSNIVQMNMVNQNTINDIRHTCQNIDRNEKILREIISSRRKELECLNGEYNNIMDVYSGIVKSLIKDEKL